MEEGAAYLTAAALLARVAEGGIGTTMVDLEATAADATGRDPRKEMLAGVGES